MLRSTNIKSYLYMLFSLILITTVSALIQSKSPAATSANAESSSVTASVTVENSCTMSGSIETNKAHTAIVQSGSYTADIGETLVSVNCNDSNGYSVYAIGFTGDVDGTTTLVGANTNLTIPTGTSTSTASSNWAMKLSAVSGTSAPTILSDTNGSFASYHIVPSTATKVATLTSNTESSSSFKTTYAVAIGTSQPADTYSGQVKYTLVHPNNADADGTVPMTINDLAYMQDFATLTSTEKTQVLASMTEDQQYQLMDNRDNKTYYISKLADGNVWMTQNLDHDIVAEANYYTPQNTDIPSAWTPTRATYPTATTGTSAWCVGGTWNANGWCEFNNILESYDPGNIYWNGAEANNIDWSNYRNSCTFATNTPACNELLNPVAAYITNNDAPISQYHIGNFYNWNAAVAINDTSSLTTSGQVIDQSICPAGWALPRPGTGEDSFKALLSEYGFSSSPFYENKKMWESPLYFTSSGYWDGYLGYVGDGGRFWSPVTNTIRYAELAYFSINGNIYPSAQVSRGFGGSIRCILRPVASTVSGL